MKRLISTVLIPAITFMSAPALANTVKVRAGVVKGNGDVSPVARESFVVYEWNPMTFVDDAAAKVHLEGKPDIVKYQAVTTNALGSKLHTDPAYLRDLKVWNAKARDAALRYRKGLPPARTFKTDLAGNAELDLPPGSYYIVGNYSNVASSVAWVANLKVDAPTVDFEISNDNALVISSLTSGTLASRLAALDTVRNIIEHDGIYLSDEQPKAIPDKLVSSTPLGEAVAVVELVGIVGGSIAAIVLIAKAIAH